MDPLEILSNLDNVIPYFQPIFSADEHKIIGYEVLGRYNSENDVVSLGPFFSDKQIPEEFRLEVDNTILTKALDKALSLDDELLIFVNRDADLLMLDHGEGFLKLLQMYQEKGININRIVLEISERNYEGSIDHLDHLLNYYRTYGLKLAIDKLGKESSHLDRIGQLAPNILKVDLHALRSTELGPSYYDILYSLSMLARKIGATLLFENIEMVYQLQYAWKNGGRYYQGYYLMDPQPTFQNTDILKERLKEEFHSFIVAEKLKLESIFLMARSFQNKTQELVVKSKKFQVYQELLEYLGSEMNNSAFRLYVCDEDGFQLSPNYYKNNKIWVFQDDQLNKNWSWRPYFLENIVRMKNEKRGILSDLYSDIETGETIRTFSYPLTNHEYLFIDISHEYLYEHNGL